MKQLTVKIFFFFILVFLPTSSMLFAGTVGTLPVEGILQDINIISEKNTILQIEGDWYPISSNSDIYICGTKQNQKKLKTLKEFIDSHISLLASSSEIYTEIHILCE